MISSACAGLHIGIGKQCWLELADGVEGGLIIEMRRIRVARLAERKDAPCNGSITEFNRCDVGVTVIAIPALCGSSPAQVAETHTHAAMPAGDGQTLPVISHGETG